MTKAPKKKAPKVKAPRIPLTNTPMTLDLEGYIKHIVQQETRQRLEALEIRLSKEVEELSDRLDDQLDDINDKVHEATQDLTINADDVEDLEQALVSILEDADISIKIGG